MDEGEPEPLLEARHEEWKQIKGSEWDRSIAGVVDEDAALGQVVVEDFGGARVMDRLLMYERRIESSLYRTMGELRRERQARAASVASEEVPRSEGNLTAPEKLASFGAEPSPEQAPPAKATPYSVTTNPPDAAMRRHSDASEQVCKTNPIPEGGPACLARKSPA